MKPRFVSVIANVDGVEREIVEKRQTCDGWAEMEGNDLVLHLTSDEPLGPILMTGSSPRIAIYRDATSPDWLAAFNLVQRAEVGDYVHLT